MYSLYYPRPAFAAIELALLWTIGRNEWYRAAIEFTCSKRKESIFDALAEAISGQARLFA